MSDDLIDYKRYKGDELRIAHEHGSLEYVPEPGHVDLDDKMQRHNLKRQIKMRKQIMAGLHREIKELEEIIVKS